MTAAHQFWTYALGCMAAVVVILCLLALAYRIWERRLTGPITDDLAVDEYADRQQVWAELDRSGL